MAVALQQRCAQSYNLALWVAVASPDPNTTTTGVTQFHSVQDVDRAIRFVLTQLVQLPGFPASPNAQFVGAHSPVVANVLQNWTTTAATAVETTTLSLIHI